MKTNTSNEYVYEENDYEEAISSIEMMVKLKLTLSIRLRD